MRRRLVDSRTEAARVIADGRVTIDGAPAAKAATLVTAGAALVVAERPDDYASRGGHKLAGALASFRLDPKGRIGLDAGASTGGFTDVLLQAGAARVVAVDVGYGQLAWRLQSDERVVVRDRTNVRHLTAEDVPPPPPDLVVADLSFISLRIVLPALVTAATHDADFVLLVKPQFEAGRAAVGEGGVVRDPSDWQAALHSVTTAAAAEGLGLAGICVSPLPGPAGNIEFFVWLQRDAARDVPTMVDAAVADGRRLAGGQPDHGSG